MLEKVLIDCFFKLLNYTTFKLLKINSMKLPIFFFTLVSLLFISCSKPMTQEHLLPYVGTYNYDGIHIRGIMYETGTDGHVTWSGLDTITLENEAIRISAFEDTDTLIISGLVYSHGFGGYKRKSVRGVLSGTTIKWDYYNSTYHKNDYTTGTIKINGEGSFDVNYLWNTSDTQLEGAFPVFGSIEGNGER